MSLLHPEVEHLLAEIAADPNSSLLRIPRAKVLPELFRPSDPIRPSAYFLTSAERHLLSVHREEVAHWLRVGLVFARTEGKRAGSAYYARQPMDRKAWLSKRSAIATGGSLGTELRHWVSNPGLWLADERRALEVQVAAQRLQPSPLASVVSAQLLTAIGDHSSALRVLRERHADLQGTPYPHLLQTSAGVVLWRLGRHREASVAYEAAWRADPTQGVYLAAAALNGALAGSLSADVQSAWIELSGSTSIQQVWSAARKQPPPRFDKELQRARENGDRTIRRIMEVFDNV
ncbi:MAG: hypothetical protein GC161_02180 [Planctomycetaceae bacterium]|nr:hypothetical protein [Planctomycetaceae bacterium]